MQCPGFHPQYQNILKITNRDIKKAYNQAVLRGEMNNTDKLPKGGCAHVLTFTQQAAEMFMLSRDDQDSERLPMRILIAKSLEK